MRENARGEIQKIMLNPDRYSAAARYRYKTAAQQHRRLEDRLQTACTRLHRYYTRHMHFLNFPFPPAVASPRENIISSRYNAPVGTISSPPPPLRFIP